MGNTRDVVMEVHFDIQSGLSIFTFVSFLISDLDLTHETSLRLSLCPMDGGGPQVVLSGMGRPDGQSGAVLGLLRSDDTSHCLKLFFEGKDMHFEVDTNSGERLIRLPLPNDRTFQTAYRASYDRVRAADNANFRGLDGIMGRINRFVRELSSR